MSGPCQVVHEGTTLRLIGPRFEQVLDLADGIRTLAWRDSDQGRAIESQGGQELGVWLDQADERIWISGWRGIESLGDETDPDADPGLVAGYMARRFDDRTWQGMHSPSHFWYGHGPSMRWARTHVFVPEAHAEQPLSLVLGGIGLFDYDWMRIYLNGVEIGTREVSGRWREPGRFELGPGSAAHQLLRYGADNVIALQLRGYVARNARLAAADASATRLMPLRSQWPAQFMQYLVVGQHDRRLGFRSGEVSVLAQGDTGEVAVAIDATDGSISGELRYRWHGQEQCFERDVSLVAEHGPVRLMRVDLLEIESAASMSEGEQGAAVFIDDAFFASVAHPAGWATAMDGRLSLHQYPGRQLSAGESWQAMSTVVGAAGSLDASAAFRDHVAGRMRRKRRGHDTPISIATGFGSWSYDPATSVGPYAEVISQEPDEATLLANLAHLHSAASDGLRFDVVMLDFWIDQQADLEAPDLRRFPSGFAPLRDAIKADGARFGVWIDSSMAAWTIGENPLVSSCLTHDPAYGTERASLCWASEPYRSLARGGYLHLVANEGVGLMKFDNLQSICYRADHDHLPGIWSTEAIMSAVLGSLHAIDRRAPDTFLMLYWGHRSAWWLLGADTVFEPGFWIEAAHPASSPTLYVRDSVIQGLDQAQRFCLDLPALGKDSLGVWLSDWKWNSSIGSERWQEAMVMDIGRGSLINQIWGDETWLTSPQRRQLARFNELVKAKPDAFAASKPIGGDPWQDEPYGYVCSDGERAFVAYFNATWSDAVMKLELGPEWNLPRGGRWRIVRHYPAPAELTSSDALGEGTLYHLRPFEVVLLECLPSDAEPALGSAPATASFRQRFDEPSVPLTPRLVESSADALAEVPFETAPHVAASGPTRPGTTRMPAKRAYRLSADIPASRSGATAVLWLRLWQADSPCALDDIGGRFAARATLDGRPVAVEPVVRDRTYSTPWQAWRVGVDPSTQGRQLELRITTALESDTTLEAGGAFVPVGQASPAR